MKHCKLFSIENKIYKIPLVTLCILDYIANTDFDTGYFITYKNKDILGYF